MWSAPVLASTDAVIGAPAVAAAVWTAAASCAGGVGAVRERERERVAAGCELQRVVGAVDRSSRRRARLPPTFSAPAEACVTVIVWFPIESDASEARVENPSACPPVASRIAAFAVTGAAVLAKTLRRADAPGGGQRVDAEREVAGRRSGAGRDRDRVLVRRRRDERVPRGRRRERAGPPTAACSCRLRSARTRAAARSRTRSAR